MSTAEKLKLQKAVIEEEILKAEKDENAKSLRKSFARLAEDDSLPINDVVAKALHGLHALRPSLPEFTQRLAVAVQALDATRD